MAPARVSLAALPLLLVGAVGCQEPEAGAAPAPAAQSHTTEAHTTEAHTTEAHTTEAHATAAPSAAAQSPATAAPPAASGTVSAVASASAAPAATAGARPTSDFDRWPELPQIDSDEPGDRIYSKVRHLWVRSFIGSKSWIGYLSLGDSVRVQHGDAKRAHVHKGDGKRCVEWYRVEPSGFVCTGEDATLDRDDPVVVELRRHGADRSSPWPYRYAESVQVPVYPSLPSPATQRKREEALEQHLEKVKLAQQASDQEAVRSIDERLVGVDLKPSGLERPKLLELGARARTLQRRVMIGSTLAYTDSFDHEGRSWLMTWDRGYVPKDKVRPYPRSEFHGVILGVDAELPLAFFRTKPRPKYRRNSDGSFEATGANWPRLSFVALSGTRAKDGPKEFLETRETGVWCAADDAALAERSNDVPKPVLAHKKGRHTWLDISILGGVLVAYEGAKPVYATLISPGRGGIPHGKIPTIDTASTPTGSFRVLGKFLTATMTSSTDASLVHAEVQYTQNFGGPYALHGAYWHNDWGQKKSGGCVNLAPIDARRVFRWTEPALPSGWRGMRSGNRFGPRTYIRLRR